MIAVAAVILGLVLRDPGRRATIVSALNNAAFQRTLTVIALVVVLGGGILLKLVGGATGLPWWVNLLGILASVVWLGAGVACYIASLAGWASGRVVWIILLMSWILVFLFFFGSRTFLFGADLYQWGFGFKWFGFTLIWILPPVAIALWLLLAKIEGNKLALGSFVALAITCDILVVMDAIQYPGHYVSLWTGELVVKASVHPDGSLWPIPLDAKVERNHPGFRNFRTLDLENEADQLVLEDWNANGVSVGDKEAEIAARKDCEAKKAAAKMQGLPVPACSVTGIPTVSAFIPGEMGSAPTSGNGYDGWLWALGFIGGGAFLGMLMGSSFSDRFWCAIGGAGLGFVITLGAGNHTDDDPWHWYRTPAELPLTGDLSSGKDITFLADLQKEAQMGGPIQLLVCDAQEPNKLLVRNGHSSWAEQSHAVVGVPISLVFDHGVATGYRPVTVRYAGRGAIHFVLSRGNAGLACDPGTTGYLIGQQKANAEVKAAATPTPPVATTPTTP
jgi:hypothetical protein